MFYISRTIFIILTIVFVSCSKNDSNSTDAAADKMQEFVINISAYARQINPDFIIIPQNGHELCFNQTDIDEGFNNSYIKAINGLGIEELFYNGTLSPDNERLSMLRKIKQFKKIFVSEYVSDKRNITDAFGRNEAEGFCCFVRDSGNYYYNQIPDSVHRENNANIIDLSLVKNYLYLISSDKYASKQEMLDAVSETNFDLIIIDLFFNDTELTADDINKLKTRHNGGKRLVISYISIGSAENYRYYWEKDWKLGSPSWIKKKYEDYPDEYWVEFWNKNWQDIIYGNENSYIKKIIDAGFDGAYLDNVEAYYFLYND